MLNSLESLRKLSWLDFFSSFCGLEPKRAATPSRTFYGRTMKTLNLLGTGFVCLLLISCAEAPEYEPRPKTVTSTNQPAQQGKTQTGDTTKTGDATKTADATMMPNNQTPMAAATPTPTPTPAATPPPAPAAPVGVAATGKTLLMQTCVNATCHSAATNTIDAKTGAALQAAGNLMIAVHTANKATHFTPPAAGAAANSYTHVLAYLMSIPTPVMGPNLP
jgi:hypothetical protein